MIGSKSIEYGSTSAQCNRGVNHAFEELTGSKELEGVNANDMIDVIEKSENFEPIDLDKVSPNAKDGEIVVAGKKETGGVSGHVALAVPGDEVDGGSWGGKVPVMMDTGKEHRWSKKGINYSWVPC